LVEERAPPPVTCHFCEILKDPASLAERTVFADESFHLSHHLELDEPTYLGMLLLQSCRHVEGIAELRGPEAARLGRLLQASSEALTRCTGAPWTYVFSFAEGFRHLHLFVVARYADLPKEFVRLSISDWPGAPKGGREQVVDLSRRLGEVVRQRLEEVG
jgi:histidine triad (HIT) family protein